ncbi:MAG: hypothetical protein AAGD32_17345 [Planctomycetota bacterium]
MLKIGACGDLEATGSDNADPTLYDWTLVTLDRSTGEYVAGDPAKTGTAAAQEVNKAIGVPQNAIVEAWRVGKNVAGDPVYHFRYNVPVTVDLESTSGDQESGWVYKVTRRLGGEVIAENVSPFIDDGLDRNSATSGYGHTIPGGTFELLVTNETLLTESCNE